MKPEYQKALNYSVFLLSRCSRSKKEIVEKLKKKNYTDDVITRVLSELISLNYLDDSKFAKNFIEMRLNQSKGGRLIRNELLRKGIEKNIIDESFTKILEERDINEYSLAKKSLQRKISTYKKDDNVKAYRRAKGFLLRRGFSYNTIEDVLSEFLKKRGENEETGID